MEDKVSILTPTGKRALALTHRQERKFYRSKAKPYIVYLHLVAVPHKFYHVDSSKTITFKSANLGKILMLLNKELYAHLRWLETHGYITALKTHNGYVKLRIPRPANYKMFFTGEPVLGRTEAEATTILDLYDGVHV